MNDLDDTKKYLMAVAMACLNYKDYLKIDEKKQIETLGLVLRLYQDKLNKHKSQELALLVTYLVRIKEDNFLEYIELFNHEIISSIIGKSKSIDEQINYLNYIEEKYYEFMADDNKELMKELINLI